MSYSVGIHFRETRPSEVLDTAIQIAKTVSEAKLEIIQDNKTYAPSYRLQLDGNGEAREPMARAANRYWLYRLFEITFLYWGKYNLLGVIGCLPEKLAATMPYVFFQNSTDQDYDFSEWPKFGFFGDKITQVKSMSLSDIKEQFDYEMDEGYLRRSLVYENISKCLGIETYLYCPDEWEFQKFVLQALANEEQHLEARIILDALLRRGNIDE